MIKTVTFKGVDLTIKYEITKGFPETHDHPGDPDEIEISSITCDDDLFTLLDELEVIGEIESIL